MLTCGVLGSGHLPIIFGIIFFANVGLTYLFAVFNRDVDAVWPYISAAGDRRPESCLFGLLLNLSAFLSMVIIYLRYLLVKILVVDSDEKIVLLNRLALLAGMFGGASMLVVANVQETAIHVVHITAAISCFSGSIVYMALQTTIASLMYPLYNGKRIIVLRGVITIVAILSFITAVTFGTIAASVYHKYYPDLPTPRPWSRKYWQPGYDFHIVSAVAEWVLAFMNAFFLISFSREFEKIRVSVVLQSLVSHLDHSPLYISRQNSYE